MSKRIDITGKRFGRLSVISRHGRTPEYLSTWQCRCDCGKTTIVNLSALKNGLTRSCGCLQRELNIKNHSGQRFTRLLVMNSVGISAHGEMTWRCRCDCGTIVDVIGSSLRRRKNQSCGCLRRELAKQSTHGHTKTSIPGNASRTYVTWRAMIQRCHDSNHHNYPRYGASGISVTKPWRDSFESFLNDMGERPLNHTIDRIDNRFGYFMANCRWATPKQQAANRG